MMTYREIEAIRNEIGATVEAFCSVLGISKSTYYKWVDPKRSPCGSTAQLLELLRENPVKVYAELREKNKVVDIW